MAEIVNFTPNPNLEKQLHTFPVVSTSTKEVADAIANEARAIAPVVTGRYRDGIISQAPNAKGVARVAATDQKSSWVEFGTATQSGQFVLRTAVESLGLHFKKSAG